MERPTTPPPAPRDLPGPSVPVRQVARSFYGMLTSEGFTQEQIVTLASDLLSLVQEDLGTPPPTDRR